MSADQPAQPVGEVVIKLVRVFAAVTRTLAEQNELARCLLLRRPGWRSAQSQPTKE